MKLIREKQKPGSQEAVEAGCTCPVIDNHHGDGIPSSKGGPLFWRTIGCPVHDAPGKDTA